MANLPMRNFLSLIQKRFLQTPVKAAAAAASAATETETLPPPSPLQQCKFSNFTVDFLVNSCGLPLKSAISTSKRFQLKESNQEKYQSVVEFFKLEGFSQIQIAKLVEKKQIFLKYNVERNLKPKFDFLRENGVVGESLREIIMKAPVVMQSSLASTIKPRWEFLESYFSSNKDTVAALRSVPWLLTCDLEGIVDLLTKEGVPASSIEKLLITYPVLSNCNRLVDVVNAVKNLGIEPTSPMFVYAFRTMGQMSESTLEKKKEVLRSLGWTTEDILSTMKKLPYCFTMSEEKLRRTMDFYVNTVNWDPQTIVRNPCMLGFGIDSRLRPRYDIFKILESKKLIRKDIKMSWFQIADKNFLENYVIKYVDQVPGLLDIYGRHKYITQKKSEEA